MTSRRKLRAQVADLTRQLREGSGRNARLCFERDAAQVAEDEARETGRQALAEMRAAEDERGRLARQVVDLTAEVEKLRSDVAFAKRVGVQHYEEAEMLRADVADLHRHRDLLIRVGAYGMKRAAPIVRAEWADAVRGVSRRDEHNRFVRAATAAT